MESQQGNHPLTRSKSPPASPTLLQRWLMGARPRTLPASISPVLVGCGLAFATGSFNPLAAFAALVVGVMIQIGTNLINDVIDYIHGTDNADRLGPVRVTQAGLLTPRQVWIAVAISYGMAALAGLYLVWLESWLVLGLGLACMLAGFLYSTGPFALSRNGLGDLFAILFFGFIAVCGTALVVSGEIPRTAWPSAFSVGVLVANILIVNNIRDIPTDRRAGRTNIAIRFGRRAAEIEYAVFLTAAYLTPVLCVFTGILPFPALTLLFSLPMAWSLFRRLLAAPPGKGLNLLLAQTARLLLVYSLLFSVGLAASRYLP
jgi:1,4-dihydroxy-2-naphthoate octaprenyltransferase